VLLKPFIPHVCSKFQALQFVATVCQHTPAYVSIRQHTSAYVSIRQHASADLQFVATVGNIGGDNEQVRCFASYSPPLLVCLHPSNLIRQHTSAHVSIRQHTSAYVIIFQHTSAHVSIRQHTCEHTSAYSHVIYSAALAVCVHASNLIRQHTSA
jgi:hypothetical protein